MPRSSRERSRETAGAPLRPLRPLLAGLLVLAAAAAGCAEDGTEAADVEPRLSEQQVTEATDPPGSMPAWIDDVSPPPGATEGGTVIVAVDVNLRTENQVARLEVDGVDVTSQSIVGEPSDEPGETATPARLIYDPEELEAPLVALGSGLHLATVRLVKLVDPEAGDVEEEGSFSWLFEVP